MAETLMKSLNGWAVYDESAHTELAKKQDKLTDAQLANLNIDHSKYLTEHQDISGKADAATTLSGYGITDAYTKTDIDTKLGDVETVLDNILA